MKNLNANKITQAVEMLAKRTNYYLTTDVRERIHQCRLAERDAGAEEILGKIEDNIRIAGEDGIPLCQDTGMACVFLRLGQDVHIYGGDLVEAVNAGVRAGYEKGYLRKSVVADPLRRRNTGDNTPANIHVEIVPGDDLEIVFAPKGFGSENMSRLAMLTPAAGEEGVREFVIDTVRRAGGRPCPPVVVGVGIGGTFDQVALMAKKALLVPMDRVNPDPYYARLESDLLREINRLGIGPQGFGGDTTALAVKIVHAPTHIAGLPVAVNINCHVARHEVVIV